MPIEVNLHKNKECRHCLCVWSSWHFINIYKIISHCKLQITVTSHQYHAIGKKSSDKKIINADKQQKKKKKNGKLNEHMLCHNLK